MSKRQLGIGFVILGVAAAAALLIIDVAGAGRFAGIGPAQRLALLGAGMLILVGVTLIPLGDRPA